MDLRIKSVRIQNFRSIADATLELSSGINVLAGPNGSGKSNILKAISRFSERNTFSQNDQSRFSRESFRIDAGTIYGHSLRIEGQNIIYNNNKISGFRSNIFLMEALRGYPEESHVPQDLYHLRADGSNLAGILNYYKGSIASSKDLDMLLERIRTITPEIDDIGPRFQGEDKAKLFVKLKKNKETYTFTPESMSTGSLDAIFLTLALQIFGEGSIYLLDGPDSHLHAGSQESMLDLLRKVAVSESKQFIIATHSPFIVDMCSTDELFLVTRDGFRTSVEKISDKKEILDALETTDVKISDFTSSMHKV